MDGIARSEDELFHETLDDITSASSSDAEESGRRGAMTRARVAPVTSSSSHDRPPVWTPSSFNSKFSVWKEDPSSVNDRRQRFFKNWGMKNLREEPSVGPATSLATKTLVVAKPIAEASNNETSPCRTCGERKSKGESTHSCNGTADLDSNGSKSVTDNRLDETSGAVLREGKPKTGPVLSRLGPVTHVINRGSSGTSPDVSPYQESGTSKVLASPEGSLSPLWTPEAGYLHQASSSQEKLSQSFDTDNGYDTRSQDGYSAAEDYGMDEILKIRDLDSGKEFLINRFNRDGSLNMLREVDTGRELTLAEFEKVVGFSPITQEMKRRQREAESSISNEKSGRGKTSSAKKKNGWLKYFVVKKPKEKPGSGGSGRSEKPSQSGDDTDEESTKGGRLSRDGSTKGGNSREGSFAEDSTKPLGLPVDDAAAATATSTSSWRQSKKVKVKLRRKSSKELSDLHIGQEFLAHNGAIWTMKFSPDGRYLASAGQDRVVRVWEVLDHPSFSKLDFSGGIENGNSANGLHVDGGSVKDGSVRGSQHGSSTKEAEKDGSTRGAREGSTRGAEKDGSTRGSKEGSARGSKGSGKSISQSRKSSHSDSKAPLPKLFWLSEKPVRSFCGHTGDILDLSWSQTKTNGSDKLLLSSSMDKTVRLWHISEEECLRVFSHNDYVTCVQFNPVDDSFFLSGALDHKIRIWNIAEHQVVDWVDLREMVTAASYTPDGEKAIVGSYKGTCRFYNTTGNKLQLDASIDVRTENKKGRGKKITGLHCMPGDSSKVLVTSNDSRIRVYDDMELLAKYKGLKNLNSQISASYTRNGDYIISASEDSRVLIWSSDNKDPSSTKSLYRRDKQLACEEFHSRFVSVAVPWPEPSNDSSTSQQDSGVTTGSDRIDSARVAISEPDDDEDISERQSDDDDDDDKFEPSQEYLSSGRRDQVLEAVDDGGGDSSPQLQSCTSFFTDSGPKGSSTWPEEQLPACGSPLSAGPGLMRSGSLGSDDGRQGVVAQQQEEASSSPPLKLDSSPSSARSPLWGLVIVTAGLDGVLRTFQNYGHPVRL